MNCFCRKWIALRFIFCFLFHQMWYTSTRAKIQQWTRTALKNRHLNWKFKLNEIPLQTFESVDAFTSKYIYIRLVELSPFIVIIFWWRAWNLKCLQLEWNAMTKQFWTFQRTKNETILSLDALMCARSKSSTIIPSSRLKTFSVLSTLKRYIMITTLYDTHNTSNLTNENFIEIFTESWITWEISINFDWHFAYISRAFVLKKSFRLENSNLLHRVRPACEISRVCVSSFQSALSFILISFCRNFRCAMENFVVPHRFFHCTEISVLH